MQFNRKVFLDLLAMHQGNLDKKAINQVFSTIKLNLDGENMKIISTDGQRFLETVVKFSDLVDEFFINGSLFYEVLKKSNSENFSIQKNEESYKILVDKAEFVFVKKTKSDFPVWAGEYSHSFEIEAKILCDAFKKVKWAMSLDDKRPYLQGICLKLKKDCIEVCATDGLRIGFQKIKLENAFEGCWIISRKSVMELIRILEEAEENVNLSLGKNIKLEVETERMHLIWQSLLVAGEFPAYERLMTNSFASTLKINAQELTSSIDRIMIMANQTQRILTLNLSNSQNTATTDNILAAASDILPGVYEGPALQILLNGSYFLEMLNSLSGEIVINFNSANLPITMQEAANENCRFILAPIKN